MPAGIPRASIVAEAVGWTKSESTEVAPLGVISEPAPGEDMTDDEADIFEGEPGVELLEKP